MLSIIGMFHAILFLLSETKFKNEAAATIRETLIKYDLSEWAFTVGLIQ